MSKIIILGHTGYVGRNIFEYLSSNTSVESVKGFSSKELDLRYEKNYNLIEKEITPDTILIICAAIKSDNGNSLITFRDNIRMAENILLMIEKYFFEKIIVFSSNAVYGVFHEHEIIDENTLPMPDTYYGLAKYITEKLFSFSLKENFFNKLVVLRPSTIYGPGELIIPHTPSGFLNTYINGGAVTLWGDGSELREFVFIDDIVQIVSTMIGSEFNGVLNIGGGKPRSYRDALDIIGKLLDKDIQINSKPRTTDPVDKIYDLSLIQSLFPDFQFTSLEKGLELTYNRIITEYSLEKT